MTTATANEVVAAVRKASAWYGGTHLWTITKDYAKVATAPDDDVIWVTTYEDLVAELNARHPTEDPRLSYVWYDGYNGVSVHDEPKYFGTDRASLLDLAKKFGAVKFLNGYILRRVDMADELRREYILDSVNQRLRYNPRKAARLLAASKKKKAKTGMGPVAVVTFLNAMIYKIGMRLGGNGCSGVSNDCRLDYYATKILMVHKIFNFIYGRNAHRRLRSWTEMIRLWKDYPETNVPRYTSKDEKDKDLDLLRAWLDKEARARVSKKEMEKPLTPVI